MVELTPSPLVAWESFYVIVGSSGAALTGLQFVVMALLTDLRRRSTGAELNAFATPNIVHFCAALVVSAALSAPWPSLHGPSVVLSLTGVAGVAYATLVTRRAHRQTGYSMVLEDWIWYTALPFVAYATILAGALALMWHTTSALFAIAAATLVLLLGGIHNAWDTVTYIALQHLQNLDHTSPPA